MIDFDRLTPIAELAGENAEETERLRGMHAEAVRFLSAKQWCTEVEECWYGFGVGGVVAIFLFRIVPAGHADEWLWVIVGDLPTVYLVADDAPTPAQALETYIQLMNEWIAAVRTGGSLEDVYPVLAPADREHAEMLAARTDFLGREILPLLD